MKKFLKYELVLVFAFAILAPAAAFPSFRKSVTNAGSVQADRKQFFIFTMNQMNKIASTQYQQVISEARAAGTLNKDQQTLQRVRAIAKKLIAQSAVFRSDAPAWAWEVNVISEPVVNAWCMPGGKIVVYTGIIDSLNLTDAELAAIIGHEISHALKEHSREQASSELLTRIGAVVISYVADLGDFGQSVLALGAQYGLSLPFSRKHETEADNMGTELMARAGYDPDCAVNVWKKMDEIEDLSIMEILSTHPSNASRISNLKNMSKKLYPLYEAAK